MTIMMQFLSKLKNAIVNIGASNFHNLKSWFQNEAWKEMNPYHLICPVLFQIDPEKAHKLTIKLLSYRLIPRINNNIDEILHTNICGISFPNPVGLAAGFDKNSEVIAEILNLGFGFTEIGSITPRPQPGNPTPRVFRLVASQAVINRYGFNSEGLDVNECRLAAWHSKHSSASSRGIVGINLGKNKDSEDAVADYIEGLDRLSPYADYIAINISSPNTQGLRNLQQRDLLAHLLHKIMEKKQSLKNKPPLFVKIAPDQTDKELEDIAEVTLTSGIDGLIVGNTTVSRPPSVPADVAKEAGGLSGKPLFKMSTDTLRQIYKLTNGKLPLIGCGGIFTAEDAYEKILAGASLVQIYTGMVYEGPFIAHSISRGLAKLLRRDGFTSIREAVGIRGCS